MSELIPTAQGPATLATEEEIAKETDPGYIDPNLHRRINTELVPENTNYDLTVKGVNSYRTITNDVTKQPSEDLEIP